MAKEKKSFILYTDYILTISKLTDAKAGKLFKTILEYVNDKDPKLDDLLLQVAFEPIKQQLKRDLKEWDATKHDRSLSGKIGNLKRWNKDLYDKVIAEEMTVQDAESIAKDRKASPTDSTRHLAIANVAVTVTDTVTDTVTESNATDDPRPDLSNSNLYRKPKIPTLEKVKEVFMSNGGTEEMAEKFYETNTATGWFYRSSPIVNFSTMVPGFISSWNKYSDKKDNNSNKTEMVM